MNTAKWREADDDKFKHYLALLHYGIDEDILTENGVDVKDAEFQVLRNKLMYCCAERALDDAKKGGDEKMEKMISVYLAEKGKAEGRADGIEIGEIKVYHKELQLSPEEIAQKMNIPIERVIEIIKALK